MKNKFLLILFALLQCSLVFASQVGFSFSQGLKTRNIHCNISSENVKYSLSLTQQKNGLFSLKMPPVLTINTENIHLGEIRFSRGKALDVNNPSLNPSYTGILYRGKKLSIAAFTKPYGSYLSYDNKGLHLAMLYENIGYDSSKIKLDSYQVNRSETESLGNTLKFFSEMKNDFSTFRMESKLSQFNGLQTQSELKVNIKNMQIRLSFGENEEKEVFVSFGKEAVLNLQYKMAKGKAPLYGGTAQQALFSFKSQLVYRNFGFETQSCKIFKYTTGYTTDTTYNLTYNENGKSARVKLIYFRTKGSAGYFELDEIYFRDPHMTFYSQNGRVNLTLSKDIFIHGNKIKLSVNQNRELSLSTEISI